MSSSSDSADLSPEAELALVRQAQSGDEEAFGDLVRRHHGPIFRLVHSILRDEHAAHDTCQDIWLSTWRNLRGFRGDSRFSTWLHPIATRRAIDRLRSHRRWFSRFLPFRSEIDSIHDADEDRLPAAPEAIAEGDPRDSLDRTERQARFEQAIASLPPKHRAILALREVQGLSYEEIATHLGIAPGTVMSRLFSARRLLIKKLEKLPCE